MVDIRIYIAVSEIISLVLLFRLWRGAEPFALKVLGSLVVVIPFLGPIMYWFGAGKLEPQAPHLQNTGPRGEYTHRLISSKVSMKQKGNSSESASEDT